MEVGLRKRYLRSFQLVAKHISLLLCVPAVRRYVSGMPLAAGNSMSPDLRVPGGMPRGGRCLKDVSQELSTSLAILERVLTSI